MSSRLAITSKNNGSQPPSDFCHENVFLEPNYYFPIRQGFGCLLWRL